MASASSVKPETVFLLSFLLLYRHIFSTDLLIEFGYHTSTCIHILSCTEFPLTYVPVDSDIYLISHHNLQKSG